MKALTRTEHRFSLRSCFSSPSISGGAVENFDGISQKSDDRWIVDQLSHSVNCVHEHALGGQCILDSILEDDLSSNFVFARSEKSITLFLSLIRKPFSWSCLNSSDKERAEAAAPADHTVILTRPGRSHGLFVG